MFCISTPSISTSWLKPGDPLMDFDHWVPVTPGARNMKFSICLRPLAPVVAAPPREIGRWVTLFRVTCLAVLEIAAISPWGHLFPDRCSVVISAAALSELTSASPTATHNTVR